MINIILSAAFLALFNLQGCGDPKGEGGGTGGGGDGGKTYTKETVHGFTFEISSQMEWAQQSHNAYRYAGKALDDLVTVLPANILQRMRTVTLRVEKTDPNAEILAYDGDSDVLAFNDLERYYSSSTLNRPSLLLNMLARRYYKIHMQNSRPLVEQVYSAAVSSGIYASVDYFDGVGTVKKKADAANDAESYFAELSEAYWGTNDFYPFDYHDLMEYDPSGFALMEELWGVRGSGGFYMKDYERRRMQGYSVMIPLASVADPNRTGVLAQAVELLDRKLADMDALVAKPFSDFFKRRRIWCEFGSGSTTGGAAEHHPNREWLRNNGRYVEKYNCVEISNLESFVYACGSNQPLMILHEYAHAYHFSFSDAYTNQAGVLAAYNNAVNAGLYTNVDYIGADGQVSKRGTAYALTNEKEFFAENTEAYFDGNEFYPHTRAQLKEYDRLTWELMEYIWAGGNYKE